MGNCKVPPQRSANVLMCFASPQGEALMADMSGPQWFVALETQIAAYLWLSIKCDLHPAQILKVQ